ncbi:hypothetical protein [Marinobacterium lutimaris]|uniref:Uncharacterized protein n=1 Tax=Marinobacterium lutimaris TaxID=568106 RepID=A0A1H5UU18_9GAMM|nr:hypothetical protein [Marinobacterium lutimaris]SEF78539.1 hypothetical protein SAMN05444390_101508 [Marinobacterium lutimaris]
MIGKELESNRRAPAFGSKFSTGLTKREYIATQVLSSFVASNGHIDSDSAAEKAVEYAEALLRTLSK